MSVVEGAVWITAILCATVAVIVIAGAYINRARAPEPPRPKVHNALDPSRVVRLDQLPKASEPKK